MFRIYQIDRKIILYQEKTSLKEEMTQPNSNLIYMLNIFLEGILKLNKISDDKD